MTAWLQLATRNVWRNGRRSAFLVGTVVLGAASLILFISYIAATTYGLRESIIRGGLGHLQIGHAGQFDGYEEQQLQHGLAAAESTRVQDMLRADRRVRRIAPRLAFGGLVSNGQRTLTFQALAVDPAREQQAFGQFQNLIAGDALTSEPDRKFSALLGREMARRLGVKPGEVVTAMTSTAGGAINAIDLEVAGILATGTPETDLYTLQLPLGAAQELLRTDKISRLAVLLWRAEDAESVGGEFDERMQGLTESRSWRSLAPIYDQVLGLYRSQFLVFGFIIGAVVFLGVCAMTITNIFERAREIGVMRAVGISVARIRMLYACEALIQGFLGSLVGAALAYGITKLTEIVAITMPPPPGRTSGVPLRLLWMPEYSAVVLVCLPLLAACAAVIVSRRIARMHVVEIVR